MKEKIKVVVADDVQVIAENMKLIIDKNPNIEKTLVAFNGEEEIKKILEAEPDIVFTDFQMPNKNGIDVIDTILNNKNIKKKPQFILVTADRDISIVNKAREMHFDIEYKPISENRINEYINNLTNEDEIIEFEENKTNQTKSFLQQIFERIRN